MVMEQDVVCELPKQTGLADVFTWRPDCVCVCVSPVLALFFFLFFFCLFFSSALFIYYTSAPTEHVTVEH